jgi:anti-sigma factor RsiW
MNLTHEQALELAAGFVLGALDPEEEEAVREHLATCAASHVEFAELGSVVPVFAESVEPVEPPASLKARVLAAAAADLESRRQSEAPMAAEERTRLAAAEPTAFPSSEVRSERALRRTAPTTWLMRFAAVVAIAALAGWNVLLQQDLGRVRDQQVALQRDLVAAQEYQAGVAAVLDIANDEGAVATIVQAQDAGFPNGLAAVGPDGRVAVVLRDLAPTTGTEVYEGWVIIGEEAPVPIGSFTPTANGTATFVSDPTEAQPGAVLAFTREPGPGATTPTAPILSIGATTPPEG